MLQFHTIAEQSRRLLCPVDVHRLIELGGALQLSDDTRVLDLACGKGELIAQWAQQYGVRGIGVDSHMQQVAAASARLFELDVMDRVHIVESDPADYPQAHHEFDVVVCLDGTWMGAGLAGTLEIMVRALHPQGGLLMIGTAYWHETPPASVKAELDPDGSQIATLPAMVTALNQIGYPLIDMVLASQNDIDHYETGRWLDVHHYLSEHGDSPDAQALRQWIADEQQAYLHYGRRYVGWGLFVVSVGSGTAKNDAGRGRASSNPDQPVAVTIHDDMLWVTLYDGRVIGNPLAWYPALLSAPDDAREGYELSETGIHWPHLDISIRVATLLNGGAAR